MCREMLDEVEARYQPETVLGSTPALVSQKVTRCITEWEVGQAGGCCLVDWECCFSEEP